MQHPPRQAKDGERGQTLVLVLVMAVLLLAFLGLVVDVGRLFVTRQYLRNACDAGAAAAAAWLPVNDTQARVDAVSYYTQNAQGTVSLSPIPDDTELTVSGTGDVIRVITPYENDKTRVRINARRTVPTLFMRLIGIPSNTVTVYAVATGWGRQTTSAMVASGYSGGRSQPVPRFRPDGNRYAIVIEGNNLTIGTNTSGEVVAPVATSQNLYVDTNNSTGTALYGDTSSSNYGKGNDKTSPSLLNPAAAAVTGSAILDPQYYLDQATASQDSTGVQHVFTANQTFGKGTYSGFYFIYGDLTIGKDVAGTATFAATGRITVTESKNELTTADTRNRLLFYAGADPTLDPSTYFEPGDPQFNPDARAIVMNDNNSTYYGTVYAPLGYVMSSSNQTTIVGALVGDGLAITQYANNLTITYDPNFAPSTAPGSRITE